MQTRAKAPKKPGFEPLPQTILVVDDEPEILESMQATLETSIGGCHVITAPTGQQALRYLREHTVDIILSDYRMPGMNGLEFLLEARNLAPEAPRLLITAFPDLDLAVRAINDANIEAFLAKPFSPEVLIQKVADILNARRARLLRDESFARSFAAIRQHTKAPY